MDAQSIGLLEDFALFVTVAEAESLSAAARASGIPVARLSRRLAALEARLGLRLVDRTSRRFALTPEGEVYAERLRAPVGAFDEAVLALTEVDREPRGTLRLSASADFGATFLSPLIAAFARAHPGIAFDLDLSPRRVDVAAERFDAAIRIGPLESSPLTSRRFATVPNYLYASPDYLERQGEPRHPSDLASHALLPLPHMHGIARMSRDAERLDAPFKGRVSVNNLVMLRRLCGEGLGIAALNPLVAAEGGGHRPVVRVLEDWRLEPATFYFLTPGRLLPARTRAFFHFARARLGEQGY